MTDELERIRALRGDGDGPSQVWVRDTRADLLELAEQEREDGTPRTDPAPAGPDSGPGGPRRLLRRALAGPGRLAAAAAGVAAVAVAGLVVYGAVSGGGPERAPVAQPSALDTSPSGADDRPSEEQDGEVVLAARCTGGGGRYTVGYPQGWHTNPGEVMARCQVFDAEPVALEEDVGGGPSGAITIRIVDVPFDVVTDPGRGSRELSSERATVGGRTARRAVWEATGETVLPAGTRTYRYAVDLGQETLLAVFADTGAADFDARRRVLDRMMATLDLAPAGSGSAGPAAG